MLRTVWVSCLIFLQIDSKTCLQFLWILLECKDNELISETVGNGLEEAGDCYRSDGLKQPLKIIIFLTNGTTEQHSNGVSSSLIPRIF